MRDTADLIRRSALAKQAILLALRHANEALLDGTRDEADLTSLAMASEQARQARDALDTLRKRFEFTRELERIAARRQSGEDDSQNTLRLVRLGVDGGYPIEEVRRLLDAALAAG